MIIIIMMVFFFWFRMFIFIMNQLRMAIPKWLNNRNSGHDFFFFPMANIIIIMMVMFVVNFNIDKHSTKKSNDKKLPSILDYNRFYMKKKKVLFEQYECTLFMGWSPYRQKDCPDFTAHLLSSNTICLLMWHEYFKWNSMSKFVIVPVDDHCVCVC